MASLFFTCPTTHRKAPTGIETDVQSLRAAWKATLKVRCPRCGEMHETTTTTSTIWTSWRFSVCKIVPELAKRNCPS
jgi:phage FluMu protein Com